MRLLIVTYDTMPIDVFIKIRINVSFNIENIIWNSLRDIIRYNVSDNVGSITELKMLDIVNDL